MSANSSNDKWQHELCVEPFLYGRIAPLVRRVLSGEDGNEEKEKLELVEDGKG